MYEIVTVSVERRVPVHRSKGKGRGKRPKWVIKHKKVKIRRYVDL